MDVNNRLVPLQEAAWDFSILAKTMMGATILGLAGLMTSALGEPGFWAMFLGLGLHVCSANRYTSEEFEGGGAGKTGLTGLVGSRVHRVHTYKSPYLEAAVGFVLGAVGGSILGATENPVHSSLHTMTLPKRVKPLMDEARTVGPLGLGSLIGATALTTSMTSVVAGVIFSAAVASVFVVTRSCGTAGHTNTVALWVVTGIAACTGQHRAEPLLGLAIEWTVKNFGMVGLLWALSLFTIIKVPFHFIFKTFQAEICCGLGTTVWVKEKEELENADSEQRQRVAVQIEQQIMSLENGGQTGSPQEREQWAKEKHQREALEKKKIQTAEAEQEQRSLQDWIKPS
ncbi:hypothetical protein WMY93_031281 [Mugilogobius chulae]|uniref:Uncharacterized protein n=1 Tax=Mugilogobius chulae TaxID=88201 RepID=A0AAW0MEF9_9GOBI